MNEETFDDFWQSVLENDDMNEESFDDFWQSVIEYADKVGVSTEYIEDEFILDGELIKANINFKKQTK